MEMLVKMRDEFRELANNGVPPGDADAEKHEKYLADCADTLDLAINENERIIGIIGGEPELIDAFITKNEMEMNMEHWGVRLLAASCMKTLGDAPNYRIVEMRMTTPRHERLLVTVHRANGETPEEQLRIAKSLLTPEQMEQFENLKKKGPVSHGSDKSD